MITVYAISLILIGLSGVLLELHRRSWRDAQQNQEASARELRFARAQYRRRNQSSGIIGALGAAIGVGPLIPPEPWPMAIYVASLAGACFSMIVLAGLDAWATRQYYALLRTEQLAAQFTLSRDFCDAKTRVDRPTNRIRDELDSNFPER